MEAPDPIRVSIETLYAIAERHSISARSFSTVPHTGMGGSVYLLGEDFVLKVPLNHASRIQGVYTEAIAVPAARAVGVRAPQIVALDATCDLLPVPYAIYERVHGVPLGSMEIAPDASAQAWRELGRDLALLHSRVQRESAAGQLWSEDEGEDPDPRPWVAGLVCDGYLTHAEADWFAEMLDELAHAALQPVPRRFVHDVNATNIMVHPGSLQYLALLDWGGASWGDPAWDFAVIPLRAVPLVLEGYRQVTVLDDTAQARILWRHIQFALYFLCTGKLEGGVWAERRVKGLLEEMHLFLR